MSSVVAGPPLIQLPLFEFEGPLELLLNLVERRRLPIVEVSLAEVADQYLSHVRALGVSEEALADFLAIGAQLVLIKSRALLPRDPSSVGLEDEESEEELVRRLEAYKMFRRLAAELGRIDAEGATAFTGGSRDFATLTQDFLPLRPIDVGLLARLASEIEFLDKPLPHDQPITPPRVPIDERLSLLRDMLGAKRRIDWDSIAGRTVPEVVATFLAVLEMVRRGEIRVEQAILFGPIRLILLEQPSITANGVSTV